MWLMQKVASAMTVCVIILTWKSGMNYLDETFVTPLDREDISRISQAIEKIINTMATLHLKD